MWLLDKILGRRNVYTLRRRYDKMREQIDKLPVIEKRLELLRMMDRIDPYIVSLEEHMMSNFEKNKTKDLVMRELLKMKTLIEKAKRLPKTH